MPKIISRFNKTNKIDIETSKYLQKVSQHIYNIRKIMDAHYTAPIGEDKDLDYFYLEETAWLGKLLDQSKVISLGNIYKYLSRNLMFNRGKTKSAQKELDTADDFIRVALGKVQALRHKYYGSSIPTQGLEEGPLKIHLTKFLTEKQINVETSQKPKLKIEYNEKIGQLVFNGKYTIEIEGVQKHVLDCLMKAEEDDKVSWDEIQETIEGATYTGDLNSYETNLAKKSINGAVSEINKKAERYLEEGKVFIGLKNNEYWLQYEIDIDG
jgi:hypothetical protein